jgi:hypothetical protein
MNKTQKIKFAMDPEWIITGSIDAEQKEYKLMAYFQKMNVFLEEIKLYPMFIEVSVHLGNIQTIINQNRILKTKKKFLSHDDELVVTDLVVHDLPVMSDEEQVEFKKILKNVQPKLFDYFNMVKAIWTLVYDSLTVNIKRNRNNLKSKSGFFYYRDEGMTYVWRYDIRRVRNSFNLTKTHVKMMYNGDGEDLTITQLISKFSKTYKTKKEKSFPVFEILSTQKFPIAETLVPIAKRKIVSLINQSAKIERLEREKKLITNGVQ